MDKEIQEIKKKWDKEYKVALKKYSKLSPEKKRQQRILNKKTDISAKEGFERYQKQKELLEKKLKSAKTKKERKEIEKEMEINETILFRTKGMVGEKPPKLPLALRIRIKLDKIFNKEK